MLLPTQIIMSGAPKILRLQLVVFRTELHRIWAAADSHLSQLKSTKDGRVSGLAEDQGFA